MTRLLLIAIIAIKTVIAQSASATWSFDATLQTDYISQVSMNGCTWTLAPDYPFVVALWDSTAPNGPDLWLVPSQLNVVRTGNVLTATFNDPSGPIVFTFAVTPTATNLRFNTTVSNNSTRYASDVVLWPRFNVLPPTSADNLYFHYPYGTGYLIRGPHNIPGLGSGGPLP